MTVLCPSGHASSTSDYCDECGAPIAAASAVPGSPTTEVLPVLEEGGEVDTSQAASYAPCPACGARRSADDRYCEGCGYDFRAPPPDPATWEAAANPDRKQFERLGATGLSFPSDPVERRFPLNRPEVRIGRTRGRAGETTPEIDLSDDPGISQMHAVLERQSNGTYAIRDLGSTNGTTVNDDPDPIGGDAAVPLADGDRIRLGAWTTITVRTRELKNPGERAPQS